MRREGRRPGDAAGRLRRAVRRAGFRRGGAGRSRQGGVRSGLRPAGPVVRRPPSLRDAGADRYGDRRSGRAGRCRPRDGEEPHRPGDRGAAACRCRPLGDGGRHQPGYRGGGAGRCAHRDAGPPRVADRCLPAHPRRRPGDPACRSRPVGDAGPCRRPADAGRRGRRDAAAAHCRADRRPGLPGAGAVHCPRPNAGVCRERGLPGAGADRCRRRAVDPARCRGARAAGVGRCRRQADAVPRSGPARRAGCPNPPAAEGRFRGGAGRWPGNACSRHRVLRVPGADPHRARDASGRRRPVVRRSRSRGAGPRRSVVHRPPAAWRRHRGVPGAPRPYGDVRCPQAGDAAYGCRCPRRSGRSSRSTAAVRRSACRRVVRRSSASGGCRCPRVPGRRSPVAAPACAAAPGRHGGRCSPGRGRSWAARVCGAAPARARRACRCPMDRAGPGGGGSCGCAAPAARTRSARRRPGTCGDGRLAGLPEGPGHLRVRGRHGGARRAPGLPSASVISRSSSRVDDGKDTLVAPTACHLPWRYYG